MTWHPITQLPPVADDGFEVLSADLLLLSPTGSMRVGYCRVGEEGDVVWVYAGRCGLHAAPTHWTELPKLPHVGEKP